VTLEDEVRRLERDLLERGSTGAWLSAVAAIRDMVANGVDEATILRAVYALNAPLIEGIALAAVSEVFGVAVAGAAEIADITGSRGIMALTPGDTSRSPLLGIDQQGREAVAASRHLIAGGAELAAVLAPIFGHANSVQGRVTSSLVSSGGEGVRAVATEAELPVVWVAETNGCVHCLKYSGQVAEPGKQFPGGLTYGKKSYHPDPLPHPPLHPHCRCFLEPLNDPSFAEALRREANRSVLRGFSLVSESMAVRVDAARRLLDDGVDAPQSVKAYANDAVQRGYFTKRGR
jgi:hypothetical protein